ncbi:undecaprenyl-diphosphate phosphatase [Marinicauda algicola]|uniref:Undecaprenyl-diphosphatase n=1 Tax=Marinicauda algicola TaxID=2029849 RepID=A0A4S2H0L7_9PROT|nr:undecaprenyl-diphosphate phosphatase [Marinicauda algicola]TGY88933.1 undecaprenyl-diphosphate phosphatase [Marinicauda algicola]
MALFQLFILALVQGITEFLPISSSAHLILVPYVTGETDQGPLIDVMAHVGTLLAVLIYFRRDILAVLAGVPGLARGRVAPGGRLLLLIAAATPPAVIAGGLLYATGWVDALRSPVLIAWATLIFAIPLWLADRYGAHSQTVAVLKWRDAILIGLAQAIAFIPGVSRSGITMTAGRALGLTRTETARFSMLMSIPLIAALGLAAIVELARGGMAAISLSDGAIVAGLSFVSAYLAIAALMAILERVGFGPFVIYRIALAAAILLLLA